MNLQAEIEALERVSVSELVERYTEPVSSEGSESQPVSARPLLGSPPSEQEPPSGFLCSSGVFANRVLPLSRALKDFWTP